MEEPTSIINYIWAALFILVILAVYLIPSLIALLRKHPHKIAIVALNILGGWTFLVWVGALVWSLLLPQTKKIDTHLPVAEAQDEIDESVIERLIDALQDKDWDVSDRSAEALSEIGEPATEALINALAKQPNVNDFVDGRCRIAEVLGKIGDTRAIEPLLSALKEGNIRKTDDNSLRSFAAKALAKYGETVVEPLINMLDDEDRNVRAWAANALGTIGDARAVQPLINLFSGKDVYHGDWFVRFSTANALGEIGDDRAVEPLKVALLDSNSDVRQEAAKALKIFSDKSSLKPLDLTLEEENKIGVKSVTELTEAERMKALIGSWQCLIEGESCTLYITTRRYRWVIPRLPPSLQSGWEGTYYWDDIDMICFNSDIGGSQNYLIELFAYDRMVWVKSKAEPKLYFKRTKYHKRVMVGNCNMMNFVLFGGKENVMNFV